MHTIIYKENFADRSFEKQECICITTIILLD